jgi:hypothetical protein
MATLCLQNLGVPLKPGIPYQTTSLNQIGFSTFGGPHLSVLPGKGALNALGAAWFQKWAVTRRARPEVFAARVHQHKIGGYTYPLHADILNSAVLNATFTKFGSYLLAQAFPEGSPLHPSAPAGHATVAGCAVTLLKAFFDEDFVIGSPVKPDATGTTLVPYLGPPLTVGGELNKIGFNVAIGRNIAGVHARSEATLSMKLGEQVAIEILRDMKHVYNEGSSITYTFDDFDGNLVSV